MASRIHVRLTVPVLARALPHAASGHAKKVLSHFRSLDATPAASAAMTWWCLRMFWRASSNVAEELQRWYERLL